MRRLRFVTFAVMLATAWLLSGCLEDDDDVADDDSYTGTTESNIVLNVYDPTSVETPSHIAHFTGDEVTLCGPDAGSDVVPFRLESSASLVGEDGQLSIAAEGWLTDTAANPSQSLSAAVDGGTFQVTLPGGNTPFEWVSGTCYIFAQTDEEDCFNNPDIPHCGEFACGSVDEPMQNAAGDSVWMVGTFNCYK